MTTYETLHLLVTAGSILAMMYYGIRVMARGAEVRAADSERKHDESMTSLRELIEGQTESRMALRELIERTR
ncbi:MAG: hypothetical protein OXG62_04705 [Nitrospinae bacterium]|nr:hypothetical protein [Nitrospinota bacterium]